jgi:hypothetical protein
MLALALPHASAAALCCFALLPVGLMHAAAAAICLAAATTQAAPSHRDCCCHRAQAAIVGTFLRCAQLELCRPGAPRRQGRVATALDQAVILVVNTSGRALLQGWLAVVPRLGCCWAGSYLGCLLAAR